MKLLVVFALCVSIAYALPIEEGSQVVAEPILAVVDFAADSLDYNNGDLERSKRQFGGYGGYGGHGGGHHGGGYGGYGGGHHGGHHGGYGGGHHHGGHHGGWGK